MTTFNAPALSALSDTVLQLHRGSREWPAAHFATRACELLQGVLAFDACLWGSAQAGSAPRSALALQGLFTLGLDHEVLAQCLSGGNPGPVLSAEWPEPLAQRRVELHLWRLNPAHAFDAGADSGVLQFLMPHLVEAQRENRLGRLAVDDRAPAAARSRALCDLQGHLLDLDQQCLALLRVEWPRWSTSVLPEPLRLAVTGCEAGSLAGCVSGAAESARGDRTPPFHGRQVTVLFTRCGDAVLLEVRRRVAVDRLSERQRHIAELYASGHTGAVIAARLELAESTVNNHLGTIFKKLAVSSKLQLADLMRSGGAAHGH